MSWLKRDPDYKDLFELARQIALHNCEDEILRRE
jgi:hypothetical protein